MVQLCTPGLDGLSKRLKVQIRTSNQTVFNSNVLMHKNVKPSPLKSVYDWIIITHAGMAIFDIHQVKCNCCPLFPVSSGTVD